MHTKVPTLSIFLNTFYLLSSKKKLTKQQEKKGHHWKGSCEAPQCTHIQSNVCHLSPKQGAASSCHSLGDVALAGRAGLLFVPVPGGLGSVMGAHSCMTPPGGKNPAEPRSRSNFSFVEVLGNSRLDQTGCVFLAGLGGHRERPGFAGSHRVTQPWLPAPACSP